MANLREFNRRYEIMNEDESRKAYEEFEKWRDKLEYMSKFDKIMTRSLYEYYYVMGNNIDVKYDPQIKEIVEKQLEMSLIWFDFD